MKLEDAMFPLDVERGGAPALLRRAGRYALCAQPEPWELLRAGSPPPLSLHQVRGVERVDLYALAASVPDEAEAVVGLGGGQALDTAKYVAWVRGVRLLQLPSIVSVDAAFTQEIGVREQGRVRYVGRTRPAEVVVDPELVRAAPPELNRAGVGDILSCHTALFDWRLASARGQGVPWDEELAALGRSLVESVDAAAAHVAAVDEEGVRFLAQSMQRVGAGCTAAGHPRFEEGSEHFFAYAFEWLTGEHRIHGELVSLGVVAMSCVQGNDAARVADLLTRCGVRWRPHELGVDRELLGRILGALPGYVAAEGLFASVVEERTFDEALAARVWRELEGLAGG